jgi:hypothetical protein
MWHGSQLPDGANGSDDVERIASDSILLCSYDFDFTEWDAVVDLRK